MSALFHSFAVNREPTASHAPFFRRVPSTGAKIEELELAVYEKGRAEAKAEAMQEAARAADAHQQEIVRAVASEREAIERNDSKMLALLITSGFAELESRLLERATLVLKHYVEHKYLDLVAKDLALMLIHGSGLTRSGKIKISCAERLVNLIQSHLPENLERTGLLIAGENGVSIECGSADISVDIEAWLQKIRGSEL